MTLPLPRAHGPDPAPAPAASLSPVALQFTVTQLTSSRESASEHHASPCAYHDHHRGFCVTR